MTDPDLLQALRDCFHPTLRRNIVELNLVRSATLTPDPDAPGATIPGVPPRHIAAITLHAPGPTTDPDEPLNAQLLALIENRLLGLQPISRVRITLLPALFPIL